MAQPIPSSDRHRNGVKGDHPVRPSASVNGNGAARPLPTDSLELYPKEAEHGPTAGPQLNESLADYLTDAEPAAGPADQEIALELELLREENARLRLAYEELGVRLREIEEQFDPSLADRLKEYESLIEEKSDVIRELHRRLQEHHERPAAPAGATPREEELLALSEELERERQQLKDDEDALMQQMREMEVQMSRERAEMARQRSELQRLQNEIRHELELASRDAGLRERLAPLQRRHEEMVNRRGAAPPAPAANSTQKPAAQARTQKDSSILRRLFGK